jgi:Ca2+-binding EF-hand superfamily protein
MFRGGGGAASQPAPGEYMNVQGTICCRSCGTEQPFTEHTCIECGLDPWAEPPATSETRSAQSGTGSGGGPGSSGTAYSSSSMDAGAVAIAVDTMAGMGLDREWAVLALSRCGNDVQRATEFCFSNDMAVLVAASKQQPQQSSSSYARSNSHASASASSTHEENYAALADKHAECSICFDPLCSAAAAVFRDGAGRRTCHHFFHASCAHAWAEQQQQQQQQQGGGGGRGGQCPLCNAPFVGVTAVPDIDADPDAWFDACDMDGDGSLNTREVFEILKAQFPVDHEKLEADLPRLWRRWDPSMDGQIQKHEFLGPSGLLTFVRQRFLSQGEGEVAAPDIRQSKAAWFDRFDEDRSGDLSIEEVTRGLIKSFHLSSDFARVEEMKDLVANVWCVFDHDGSGEVDRDEFLRPNDGMADSIIASYQHHR